MFVPPWYSPAISFLPLVQALDWKIQAIVERKGYTEQVEGGGIMALFAMFISQHSCER
jgi:hypothetical protein